MGKARPGRRRITPKSAREWGGVLPQWIGIFGLLVCLGYYLATQQANAAILTAFAGLIVVGQGAEAVAKLGPAPPDPDTEETRGRASSD